MGTYERENSSVAGRAASNFFTSFMIELSNAKLACFLCSLGLEA